MNKSRKNKNMNVLEWIMTIILLIVVVISLAFLVKEMTSEQNYTCSESIEIQHNHPLI